MSAWVSVDCDRVDCLEGWVGDDQTATSDLTVAGAYDYLCDMEMWVRGADGERVYCSSRCMEISESAPPRGGKENVDDRSE